MLFNNGTGCGENWVICEDAFHPTKLGKSESLLCLGNGYMGVRAATEERYLDEQRGMFVAGTFNRFDDREVTELPNLPDLLQMQIELEGERLNLLEGNFYDYARFLNLRTGLLTRSFTYITKNMKEVTFCFKRIVSMADKHVIAQKVCMISKQPVRVSIKSGIDGCITNTGRQHFSAGTKRILDDRFLQAVFTTTQSNIDFVLHTGHICRIDDNLINPDQMLEITNRTIAINYDFTLKADQRISVEKISTVFTSRDIEFKGLTYQQIEKKAFSSIKQSMDKGFDRLQNESSLFWEKEIWKNQDIRISSQNLFDQLSIRFSIYHIAIMTPAHDNRMNIGAKGLSGEAYKGHTFWDTEIFLLPFWTSTNPKIARSLLEYRYHCLPGAREKAARNGYEGAMYPWESAYITDGEVSPIFGAADVITGKELPIICGDIEQHITSDVTFGIWQYFKMTDDQDFMNCYGYEIVFETANFWQSRLEWNDQRKRYEINNVIGPDEYSEHVNNNAYTNYMAFWNMQLSIEYYESLQKNNLELFLCLQEKLGLIEYYPLWKQKAPLLYLPQINKELLLPQDDDYLTLPKIDLTKYKQSKTRADIIKDYNMEELSGMQVSKQADVLVLFYLFENLFSVEEKRANFYYYEDKCLHDSSLSLSTHSIIANDLREKKLAFALYNRARTIDLNADMNGSNEGIHAASMGGTWQCVINGFAGVRMLEGQLHINPMLPDGWECLQFKMFWKGVKLDIDITPGHLSVIPETPQPGLQFFHNGQSINLSQKVTIYLGVN